MNSSVSMNVSVLIDTKVKETVVDLRKGNEAFLLFQQSLNTKKDIGVHTIIVRKIEADSKDYFIFRVNCKITSIGVSEGNDLIPSRSITTSGKYLIEIYKHAADSLLQIDTLKNIDAIGLKRILQYSKRDYKVGLLSYFRHTIVVNTLEPSVIHQWINVGSKCYVRDQIPPGYLLNYISQRSPETLKIQKYSIHTEK